MHNDPPSREKSRKAAQLMGVGCLKHPQVAPALSWCFTVVGAARGFGFHCCKVRVFCKKKKKRKCCFVPVLSLQSTEIGVKNGAC